MQTLHTQIRAVQLVRIIRVLTICYCWAFRLYNSLQKSFRNDSKELEGFENGWHGLARDLQYIGVCLTTARCQTVIRAASRAEIAQPPGISMKISLNRLSRA